MTPEQHRAQRDLVARASLLADTSAERHGVYARRKPVPVVPVPRVYSLPRVVENENWRPTP